MDSLKGKSNYVKEFLGALCQESRCILFSIRVRVVQVATCSVYTPCSIIGLPNDLADVYTHFVQS